MSVRVMSWVWDHSKAGGTDRLVLLAIADSADHDGTNAWPAVSTIARKCQVSERTVQRSIRNLEALGEIAVYAQAGGTPTMTADRRPNLYRVVMADGVTDRHPAPENGVTPSAERGDQMTPRGVTPLSPNPSVDPSGQVTPPSTDVDKDPREAPEYGFEKAWAAYPKRNGKRLGKKTALALWRKHPYEVKARIFKAVQHYAAAVEATDTIPRDFERFLKADWWEGWEDGPGARPDAPTSIEDRRSQARDVEHEKNRRRRTGEACPSCGDVGFVLEGNMAVPCRCRTAAAS
jgi:hypothetical protein